ncbi:LAFE_0H15302g1_1 [Lachancea fermentati]|uniref:LAFE_0H15302g1_1 n=1 Tax=Lachancea fermentati TaxID=4955 RepID=A0A1G4ML05_LACFM|nr:LAFE_0H15302g1_1 [Lachancea fermentati]
MIIFDDEKYSCVSCIRGHRSSTCKHSERMLVKVRTRGRPSPVDIRKVILVDTNSQVQTSESPDDSVSPCCSKEGKLCGKMNKQPILFLRAMRTQKALLVDGALKIMIEDKNSQNEGKYKFISEREYLLNHTNEKSAESGNKAEEVNNCENLISKQENHFHAPMNIPEVRSPSPTILNNSIVELFTHKGIYLSTQCTCEDNKCNCENCLIHRKEEELQSYIQQSGVPLSNLGNGRVSYPDVEPSSGAFMCKGAAVDCNTEGCLFHPDQVISLTRLLLYGILNTRFTRKSVIKYKNKLIPSKYWWNFLKLEIPSMSFSQLESLDIIHWFDGIIEAYGAHMVNDAVSGSLNLNDMEIMLEN